MSPKSEVLAIRVFVVVFIAISGAIATVQYKGGLDFIAQLMGISWGALAGSFLAPFLYSLYWKRTTKAACWASFAFGSGLMIANMLFRQSLPEILRSPINAGAIAMLAGLAIVPAVSFVTKAPDRRFIDALFACYEKTRQTTAKNDLGE